MAARSNRFPSPLSSRPRNSEWNPSIRKSFSGNNSFAKPPVLTNPRRLDPTTPANSPSDFARRRSVGMEGVASQMRDCEEKENDEKDGILKAWKLQSPAKGRKNFMAPTISAASKFTPSPRKKVLVERNDPVRTSISLSDGKAMFFSAMGYVSEELEPKSELGAVDSNFVDSEKKVVHDSHSASRPLKKVAFSDIPLYSHHSVESVITDFQGSKLESSSLDFDPLLHPYDPKTNYLSLRPQFIPYKPNTMLLSEEQWVDPDDSLMAEIMSQGFSDEVSDESYKEEMEAAANAPVSEDMVVGLNEGIEAESHVCESLPVSTAPAEEGFDQANKKKPRKSLFRLMCFSMIMVLLVAACVSIAPSFDEFVVKDLSFSDISTAYQQSRVAVADFARLSLGWIGRHFGHVWASSVSLMFSLANELGKGEKRAPLQFMNLSILQENPWNEAHFPNIVASLESSENLEEDKEVDMDTEMDYSFEENEYEEEEFDMDTDLLDTFEEEEEAYLYAKVDAGEISSDSVELAELESEYLQDVKSETELNSDGQTSHHQETELEAAIEFEMETEISQEKSMPESTPEDESFPADYSVGIPSLFAGLVAVAAAAFIYQCKKNHSSLCNVALIKQVSRKQTDYGVTSCKYTHQEKEYSDKNVIDGGESYYCPSEMTGSFEESAACTYSTRREANEVQSSERKAGKKYGKRESLATSSYGSFTTYEIKSNGNADEEIMTPVRRSNRIRNATKVE